MTAPLSAADVIGLLRLSPHPEGGWYRQTWVAEGAPGTRPVGTAIYYLLEDGQDSHWHRVDATEIWHWHRGAALDLRVAPTDQGPVSRHILGADLAAGQAPQVIVPAQHWQCARPLGGWALVGCTVSPAFQFAGFTLAAPGFDIPG